MPREKSVFSRSCRSGFELNELWFIGRFLFGGNVREFERPNDAAPHFGLDENVQMNAVRAYDGASRVPVIDHDVPQGSSTFAAQRVRFKLVGRPVNHRGFDVRPFRSEELSQLQIPVLVHRFVVEESVSEGCFGQAKLPQEQRVHVRWHQIVQELVKRRVGLGFVEFLWRRPEFFPALDSVWRSDKRYWLSH